MQASTQQVLVIEDDVMVARALSRTLSKRGYSITLAQTCAAARSLERSFEFAILDLDLPDGNGADLAAALLASRRVGSVLFFTGSTNRTLLARARKLGSVVMKSSGAQPVLAIISPELSEIPQSRTTRSSKRSLRAPSSSLRKLRAR